MSTLISGSCFIRAATIRLCFGLIFVGLAIAAHTAQSEESSIAADLDIFTIQLASSGADSLLPYRLNANVALTRSDDTAPVATRFSTAPRLHLIAEPKKETIWSTNASWAVTSDSERVSLSPILRFESKGARLEIKPRLHSIWVGWRKSFP